MPDRFAVKVTYEVTEEYLVTPSESWAYSRAAQYVQERVEGTSCPLPPTEVTKTHRITSVHIAGLADDE